MGEYLGVRFDTIRANGRAHMRKLVIQKTLNNVLKYPSIEKEVWDSVQGLHPKTLILSELGSMGKDDADPELWRTIVDEIYYTGRADTPVYLKIDMWKKDKQCLGAKPLLQLSSLKHLFILKQQLLKQLDPSHDRDVEELRSLVKKQAAAYARLAKEGDETFREMTLDQLLDVHDSFLYLEARDEDWSVIDIACTCKRCYKWAVCSHTALISLICVDELEIPGKWVQAEPGLRKARGRRSVGLGSGIAGVQRSLKLMNKIAKEKRDSIKK
jgi:hypothetical protein